MIWAALILVFFSLFSYFGYPYILKQKFLKKNNAYNASQFHLNNHRYAILIAAYNEELSLPIIIPKIIAAAAKLPRETKIYIGDDGSTDQTPQIIQSFKNIKYERLERVGKVNVINYIVEKYQLIKNTDIIFLIDANIHLAENALVEIANLFNNNYLGIVGCQVLPLNNKSNAESKYILQENDWKYWEGELWQSTAGVFGACFGIRSHLLSPIPKNITTDDLFLTLRAFENKLGAAIAPKSIVFESIDAYLHNEFNRKRRYAAGNFYIFFYYWKLFFSPKTPFGIRFSLFFHKAIRWWLPILFFSISTISLLRDFYKSNLSFLSEIVLFCLGLFIILWIFNQNGIKIAERMFYFLMMNVAILMGFYDFLTKKQKSQWERSKRT